MNRVVAVFDGDKHGWFDLDQAIPFPERTDSEGVSINTRKRHSNQVLYRTVQGRWVKCHLAGSDVNTDFYQFVSVKEATSWLIRNGHEDAVAEHLPDTPDEHGPLVDHELAWIRTQGPAEATGWRRWFRR